MKKPLNEYTEKDFKLEGQKRLFRKVKEFSDDDEFNVGIVLFSETDEICQKIIDFIDKGNHDSGDIIYYNAVLCGEIIEVEQNTD